MTPSDRLKRRAAGALHDHSRTVHFDPKAILELIEQGEQARAALAWLVRLKDDPPPDYAEQKPLAWANARAVLGIEKKDIRDET